MTAQSFPHGIMFHHFHDGGIHPVGQGSITAEMLDRMIRWLRRDHHILDAQDWYQRAMHGRLSSQDICITFDDNLLCQHDIALPVLRQHDIQAFWFVYTSPLQGVREKLELYRYFRSTSFGSIDDFYLAFDTAIEHSPYAEKVATGLVGFDPDNYLKSFSFYTRGDRIFRFTRDRLLSVPQYHEVMDLMMEQAGVSVDAIAQKLWNGRRELSHLHELGHVLGLHSHTHPMQMCELSPDEQRQEYSTNLALVSEISGQPVLSMSHPCNSYNEHTLSILRGLGVEFGFRSNMDPGFVSTLEFPRLDHALLARTVQGVQ